MLFEEVFVVLVLVVVGVFEDFTTVERAGEEGRGEGGGGRGGGGGARLDLAAATKEE